MKIVIGKNETRLFGDVPVVHAAQNCANFGAPMHRTRNLGAMGEKQARNLITFSIFFVIGVGLSEWPPMPDLLFIDSETCRCDHHTKGGM